MINRPNVIALVAGLVTSSCCLEQACVASVRVDAPVAAANEVVTVEFCFRDTCDAAQLAPEEGTRLFLDGGGPHTFVNRWPDHVEVAVEFDREPRVARPAPDDVVQLRVIDASGVVILDETRTVEYRFVGDWLCGGCQMAHVEL